MTKTVNALNLKNIVDDFRLLADRHKQLNSFGFGDLDEFSFQVDTRDKEANTSFQAPYYPYLYVIPANIIQEFGFMTYEFNLIVSDIMKRDMNNMTDILSDTLQIMNDVVSMFRLSVSEQLGNYNEYYFTDDPITMVPFIEQYEDLLCGYSATIRIKTKTYLDRCAAAFEDFPIETPCISPSPTPTNTETPTQTPTNTETPTQTPTPTNTETPTQTPTNTETPTQTQTPTNTETPTQTPTNTETPTQTQTPTNTETPTPTPTTTTTLTATNTQTPTQTPTPTNTETPTQTPTPTNTGTPTQTPTNTGSPTPTPTIAASGTTEANAYLRAVVDAGGTGITSTVSAATVTLFTSLVSNGLYDKIQAFYPMLGGNSSGCKFNGKNPLDTNAAFRLVFNGGWTFNSSGATSNGTTAYADTFLSGTSVNINDNHLSVYMLNNTVYTGTGKNWIGTSKSGVPSDYFTLGQDGTPIVFYGTKIANGLTTSGSPQPRGYNIITSTASTFQNMYRNGILFQAATGALPGTIFTSVVIGALNNSGSIVQYYDNTYAFTTIGRGLGAAEVSTLSTIINTFQTTLGRNTY